MTGHNVTIEDSSPLVVYQNDSQWADSPDNDPSFGNYSGPSQGFNSFHVTNLSATVGLPFNGSAIYLFGSMGPTHGNFTVSLNPNVTQGGDFNLGGLGAGTEFTQSSGFHAEGQLFQQLLYSRTGLDQSVPHLIAITNFAPTQFILDYFIVETEIGLEQPNSTVKEYTLDDAHPAFTYPEGSWSSNISSLEQSSTGLAFLALFNNKTIHSVEEAGAQASLTFRGSGLSIHGVWDFGSFFVRVDDDLAIPVESSNTVLGNWNRPRELIFTIDGLDEGMHNISITNSKDSPLSIDYAIVRQADNTADPENLDGVTPPTGNNTRSPSGGDPNSGTGGKNPTKLGPIIGGAVGGVIFLALTVIALWMWSRRRKMKARERVDLLSDTDSVSDRRAHTLNPWQPASESGETSEGHLRLPPEMSSLPDLSNVVSYNASSGEHLQAQGGTSSSPFSDAVHHNAISTRTPGTMALSSSQVVTAPQTNGGVLSVPAPNGTETLNTDHRTLTSPGKSRHVPEPLPEPVPRHADDAGVTLLRADTVRTAVTLPPLYDPRWDSDRS